MNQMVLKNSKISIKEAQKIVALNYDIKGSVEILILRFNQQKGKTTYLKYQDPILNLII